MILKLGAAIVLSVIHVAQGCHVWATADGTPLGANRTLVVKPGARVSIRISCPMDFDVTQTAGPRIALGGRWHTGTAHVLVFKKKGLYRFDVVNVQTPEEAGLQTLGETLHPRLIVRVR
jgi:hypothetical protein